MCLQYLTLSSLRRLRTSSSASSRSCCAREYGDSTLFVVKDPRLCRLLPLWTDALERLAARPAFVITTRNPLEVAGSLKARDGFSGTKSCLLWLRHLLDAERDSRGFARVFVSYERLLRDWVTTSERIARELHLFWPRATHDTHHQIEDYLSPALRHHSFDYSELRARSDVAEWVKQAFDAVSRAATDAEEIDSELFDEIRGQLDRADQAYGPLLAEARAEIDERGAALTTRDAELRDALLRAEEAEVDAAAGVGSLHAAREERDRWKEEAVRLLGVVSEHEESIARWTSEYESLQASAAPRRGVRGYPDGVRGCAGSATDPPRRAGRGTDLRRSFDVQRIELENARLQLSSATAQLEHAAAERQELEHVRLELDTVTTQLELAVAERQELEHVRLELDTVTTQLELAVAERQELEHVRLELDTVTTQWSWRSRSDRSWSTFVSSWTPSRPSSSWRSRSDRSWSTYVSSWTPSRPSGAGGG